MWIVLAVARMNLIMEIDPLFQARFISAQENEPSREDRKTMTPTC